MSTPFETDPVLAALPGIAHGFFGRRGGVSTGDFAALNMSESTDDDADAVARNRALALDALGRSEARLCVLRQTHSPDAVPASPNETPEGDGHATATPGLVLAILTADCVPVLLADPDAGVIGACHAGWRGAVSGVVENTLGLMEMLGARRARIRAAIGPAISGPNYEIGLEMAERLRADYPDTAPFVFEPPGAARPHFDLPAYVLAVLAREGIAAPGRVGNCTLAEPERYFSHRFATRAGIRAGRQMALIGI